MVLLFLSHQTQPLPHCCFDRLQTRQQALIQAPNPRKTCNSFMNPSLNKALCLIHSFYYFLVTSPYFICSNPNFSHKYVEQDTQPLGLGPQALQIHFFSGTKNRVNTRPCCTSFKGQSGSLLTTIYSILELLWMAIQALEKASLAF